MEEKNFVSLMLVLSSVMGKIQGHVVCMDQQDESEKYQQFQQIINQLSGVLDILLTDRGLQ